MAPSEYRSAGLTIEPSGPPALPYTKAYDYDENGNLIYEGWARSSVNPTTDHAVWAIHKLTYSGNNMVSDQWADGNSNEDNIWDNRASLSYQ